MESAILSICMESLWINMHHCMGHNHRWSIDGNLQIFWYSEVRILKIMASRKISILEFLPISKSRVWTQKSITNRRTLILLKAMVTQKKSMLDLLETQLSQKIFQIFLMEKLRHLMFKNPLCIIKILINFINSEKLFSP